MRIPNYKNYITLNAVLKMLLGQSSEQIKKNSVSILEELEMEAIDCHIALAAAKDANSGPLIRSAHLALEIASKNLNHAMNISIKLKAEIGRVRAGKPSVLRIEEDVSDDTFCDYVRIDRQSVRTWEKNEKIEMRLANAPTARTHHTPMLTLLDELIFEFWEGVDPKRLPKKEVIKAYIKRKYNWEEKKDQPSDYQCDIENLSDTVVTAMITMMRAPEFRSKR